MVHSAAMDSKYWNFSRHTPKDTLRRTQVPTLATLETPTKLRFWVNRRWKFCSDSASLSFREILLDPRNQTFGGTSLVQFVPLTIHTNLLPSASPSMYAVPLPFHPYLTLASSNLYFYFFTLHCTSCLFLYTQHPSFSVSPYLTLRLQQFSFFSLLILLHFALYLLFFLSNATAMQTDDFLPIFSNLYLPWLSLPNSHPTSVAAFPSQAPPAASSTGNTYQPAVLVVRGHRIVVSIIIHKLTWSSARKPCNEWAGDASTCHTSRVTMQRLKLYTGMLIICTSYVYTFLFLASRFVLLSCYYYCCF